MTDDEVLVFPASFAQRSMWLENEINPGRPTYHVLAALRLRGRLDSDALRRALNSVVDRHEALRTVFDLDEDGPVQVIGPTPKLDVPVTDIARGDLEAAVTAGVTEPFDLYRGPLVRMRLLRLAPEEHIAVLVMHHIVTDGMSSAVFVAELTACYGAYLRGEEPQLPPLEIQYADFTMWQHENLQGEKLSRLTRHWRGRLDGAPPLQLFTDRPYPAEPTFEGGTHAFTLPASLVSRLDTLAREERATAFMVFLAAFDVLLSRYSGQQDITVASPMAGRTRPELANLIGFFVNPLLLRTDVSGEPTARELIQRARSTCAEAYDNQEFPFESALEILRVQRRSTVGTPQVQAMLVLQNMPVPELRTTDLVIEPLRPDSRAASYELALDLEPDDAAGYRAFLEYSCELFDAATIKEMAVGFVTILEGIAADPDAPVSTKPVDRQPIPWSEALVEPVVEVPYRAPHTPIELELHEIFCELLGLERIGVDEDFLDIGGDSLSLLQLRNRVREQYGVEFPVRELFGRVDIDSLARRILERLLAQEENALSPQSSSNEEHS
ncbi:condensation domain-containing protein [Streptomyces sp. NPDC014889]|uniref:condensation domain-containing protein n=1 Tax=Streptomyces sp. NPDC014889 TaxID=3364928 RepID=UPI00370153DA